MRELLLSIAVTSLMVAMTMPAARKLGWVAAPGDHRKHSGEVPLCGGFAMMASIFFSSLILGVTIPMGLLTATGLVLLVGVIDDRLTVPYLIRFIFQIVAAVSIIHFDGVRLDDLGYVFSQDLANLGNYSHGLTIFAMVGVINAINMVDGMDGLAGSLVCISLLSVLGLLLEAGYADISFLLLVAGAIIGFLFFNLRIGKSGRGRVFMGDAGSTTLGLILAWVLVRYSQDGIGDEGRLFAPVMALWVLALPLYDTVGVLIRRIFRGNSPFDADWMHTHHVLQRLGLGVNQTLAVMLGAALLLGGLGMVLLRLKTPEHLMFYLFLGVFAIYVLLMEWGEHHLAKRGGLG